MIYDILLLMLCTFSKGLFLNSRTFFKGLFALFCHFFKGLSVGNYFFFKRKVFPFSPIIFVFLQQNFKNKRTRFLGDVVL